jgi:hypothetical protein
MLRVTNTVSNLQGEDRDTVALRNRIKLEAQKHNLPSAEDLDKIAEEQKIKEQTSL